VVIWVWGLKGRVCGGEERRWQRLQQVRQGLRVGECGSGLSGDLGWGLKGEVQWRQQWWQRVQQVRQGQGWLCVGQGLVELRCGSGLSGAQVWVRA
jgi:hypothetical protein